MKSTWRKAPRSRTVDFFDTQKTNELKSNQKQQKTQEKGGKVLEFGVWKTRTFDRLEDSMMKFSWDISWKKSMLQFELGSWAKPCFCLRGKLPPQWCCQKTQTAFPKGWLPTNQVSSFCKWSARENERIQSTETKNGGKLQIFVRFWWPLNLHFFI